MKCPYCGAWCQVSKTDRSKVVCPRPASNCGFWTLTDSNGQVIL